MSAAERQPRARRLNLFRSLFSYGANAGSCLRSAVDGTRESRKHKRIRRHHSFGLFFSPRSFRMKSSVLLTVAFLVSMKPLFYTSSNSIMFMHTQPGVTVEGQFLASLTPLPSERARCACPSGSRASLDATRATPPGSPYSGAIETSVADWESDEKHGGQFWRVMLHDDDVHTLDYAIETVRARQHPRRCVACGPHRWADGSLTLRRRPISGRQGPFQRRSAHQSRPTACCCAVGGVSGTRLNPADP